MFFNVAGIDPGVIHTGIVTLKFDFMGKELTEKHAIVDGIYPLVTAAKLSSLVYPATLGTCDTFIEKYRPRSGFSTNDKLMEANATLPPETMGELLQNTGVVKVVSKELMELLEVWKFPTSTHHQDLRSAARIALLGMMLNPNLNPVLYGFVVDQLEGRPWDVRHH